MAVTIVPKNTNGAIKRLTTLFMLSLTIPSKSSDILRKILTSFGH